MILFHFLELIIRAINFFPFVNVSISLYRFTLATFSIYLVSPQKEKKKKLLWRLKTKDVSKQISPRV
jgi:hypothetical protein